MFGASPTPGKDHEHAVVPPSPTEPTSGSGPTTPRTPSMDAAHADSAPSGEKRNSTSTAPGRKSSEDAGSGADKKRRSSGVAKASALFATAKNTLHLSHVSHSSNNSSTPPQTPMQKLSKTDPALGVPQGSLNNSAGESRPGPRSTFRVGVTEDKNKKCRRTMEDTHAYLYNFLSTPAPLISTDASSSAITKDSAVDGSSTASTAATSGTDADSVHTIASRVVETDNGYFAIFDGHAGTFAADWCGKKLHVLLEDIIRKNPNSAIPELLDQAFTSADQQLEKLPLKNSGCTAICAVLRWEDRIPNPQSATGSTAIAPIAAAVAKAHETSGNGTIPENAANLVPSIQDAMAAPTTATAMPKLQASASRQRVLYTANVGDARIVLCRNGKALRLSYDHKGSDENEGRRITNAGGLILNNRVNGVLAVTRALGDTYMKDLVTGHPYTTETVIQPDIDEFLILACDGLWDVCTDQEAVDLIRHTPDPQVASKQLVDYALQRFSTDNLSCMVVKFDNQALRQAFEHKTEAIGVEGDPSSLKFGGISEADAIVKEARKSMGDIGADGHVDEETLHRVSKEIIKEEEDKEAGPEADPEGVRKLAAAAKNKK